MAKSPTAPAQHLLSMAYDGLVSPRHGNQNRFVDLWYATWFLRQGSVTLEVGGERIEASAGDWVFCDPYLMRSQRFSDDAHLLSVRFGVHWGERFHFLPLAPPRVVRRADQLLLSAGEALLGAIARADEQPTLAEQCRVTAAFHAWLALWHERRAQRDPIRPVTEDDPVVSRLVAALSEHRGVGVLDYARLSAAVGLSRSQIDRVCKARLGLTPRQWCERRSLAQAERWLRAGRLSVKEIAYQLGFVDGSHFARWFRGQTGQSPTGYRGVGAV